MLKSYDENTPLDQVNRDWQLLCRVLIQGILKHEKDNKELIARYMDCKEVLTREPERLLYRDVLTEAQCWQLREIIMYIAGTEKRPI